MHTDIRIYSLRNYSGEPQLEALVDQDQLTQAITGGLIRQDRTYGIWRLTKAGDRIMNDPETTFQD